MVFARARIVGPQIPLRESDLINPKRATCIPPECLFLWIDVLVDYPDDQSLLAAKIERRPVVPDRIAHRNRDLIADFKGGNAPVSVDDSGNG
ncbi:hypothetical protein AXG89_41625 (plasmid) [Burkholderia sp. PAMC 26561]|nr:hypothetical protein AXG89_41425 [Burkholderia sp. PAMC 26561]AMH42826.1 hypothetical protein AXG89_41625 [Burkholderia sp. PAMC 26561]